MPEAPVTAIVDTSPLLYLYQVGRLELLRQLYGTVIVPPAAPAELETGRQHGYDVPDLPSMPWIYVRSVASAALVPDIIDLGEGEAQVIALGLETSGRLLILDDQLGRRIADWHRLHYTGTLGVLVKAKQAGYLASVAAVVTALRAKGMWLSEEKLITSHMPLGAWSKTGS